MFIGGCGGGGGGAMYGWAMRTVCGCATGNMVVKFVTGGVKFATGGICGCSWDEI